MSERVLASRLQPGDRVLHRERERVVTQSCAPLGGGGWMIALDDDPLTHYPFGTEFIRTITREDAQIEAMFQGLAE